MIIVGVRRGGMATRYFFMIVAASITFGAARADDGRRGRDDNRRGDGRGGRQWHRGHGHNFCWPLPYSVGVGFSSPLLWGIPAYSYYDPYLAEANQAAVEFQRQQARQDAERAVQAEAEAQAAAAERLAALKAESRRKRSAAAAKTGARQFAAGNYRNAASNYQEAVSLVADDATVQLMLAQSQFAMKRFFDAAQTLRTAIRLNPQLVGFDVLTFYKDAADFRDQLTALADELRVNPLNKDAMLLFGHMLYVSGRRAEAKTILLESAKLGVDAAILRPYLDSFVPPPPVAAR
jgi:tetratricopeptide (TPR) repeat protein